MRKYLYLLLVALAMFALTGCSLSGDDDKNSGPVTVNPPADAAAFNGATISFNPSIGFTSNGTVNEFTYVNNLNDESLFPKSDSGALTGSFTYSVIDSSKRKIDFVFADTTKNFSIELKGFLGVGRLITNFLVTKVGDSSNTVYPTTIVSGSLNGAETSTSTSTSTNTSTSTDATGGQAATTPELLQGKVVDLTFADAPTYSATPKVPTSFPYKNGDIVKFSFSSSSDLMIGNDYRNLGKPRKYAGSPEYVWYDATYKINYCVTLKEDGTLYKINVRSESYTYSTDDTHSGYYGMFYIPI